MKVLGNYRTSFYPGETNEQPSLTQPDQTMSVRELLKRHQNGIPFLGHDAQFTADSEGFDPYEDTHDICDPVELEELASFHARSLNQLRDRIKNENEVYKEQLEKKAKEKNEQQFAAFKTRLQRETEA